MQEFILAETSEIIDTQYPPYGEITSDKWVYRIIATIDKDGDVFINRQAGKEVQGYDYIEFEDDSDNFFTDFNKKDFNLDEVQRFQNALICK